MILKRRKKSEENIDFTLLEKIKKKSQSQLQSSQLPPSKSESNSESNSFLGFSNLSMFAENSTSPSEQNQFSSTSTSSNQNFSSSFIEQKVIDIYEKLLEIEQSIEELKKKLKSYDY
ncbi:MAG: hypothetical protein QW244_03385 [Candidatus Pacearchaeota archaeon]